jgi:hypothetical protein
MVPFPTENLRDLVRYTAGSRFTDSARLLVILERFTSPRRGRPTPARKALALYAPNQDPQDGVTAFGGGDAEVIVVRVGGFEDPGVGFPAQAFDGVGGGQVARKTEFGKVGDDVSITGENGRDSGANRKGF